MTLFPLLGCGREASRASLSIVAVRLTCQPIARGVQCRLLALSRDASQPPRDVTADASWHLSGGAGAHVSTAGIVEAAPAGDASDANDAGNAGDGGGRSGMEDVEIAADYQSLSAHRMVRLSRTGPGQVLAVLSGRALVEDKGALRPVAAVRLEVVSGPDAGKSATTDRDGGYELTGLAPGKVDLRATKPGYDVTAVTVSLEPGDARLTVLMERRLSPSGGAALSETMRRPARSGDDPSAD
jgi:hypothetical protein